MASYEDGGVTGYRSTYVLEAGEYRLYVGNSVKDARHVNFEAGDAYVVNELRFKRMVQTANGLSKSLLKLSWNQAW